MWCSRNVCIRYPYFILGILHIKNVWVFVVGAFVAMLGMYFFQTQCWALVTDVIDDMEVQTGNRDDGTIYGIYSFSRKIGQAIAGGLPDGHLDGLDTMNLQQDRQRQLQWYLQLGYFLPSSYLYSLWISTYVHFPSE